MLPSQWSVEIGSHRLRCCDDVQDEAIQNMLVFQLAEIPASALEAHELEQLLMDVYRVFVTKAAAIRFDGWFYAWFDEMSGTLRCSACRATASKDLPFACALDVLDTAEAVAREAANSTHLSGIPADELHESEFSDATVEQEFRLRVFARPLLCAV